MAIVDSSLLVASFNPRDVHHDAAMDAIGRLRSGEWGAFRIPEYVFLETVTVLAARAGQKRASAASRHLARSPDIHIVPGFPLFEAARLLFEGQAKARWSFTDAAIVALARDRDDPFIASFDTDFDGLTGIQRVPAGKPTGKAAGKATGKPASSR